MMSASKAREFLQLPLLSHDEDTMVAKCGSSTAFSNNDITDNDVLCGRGGVTNCHAGNRRFRELVKAHQPTYLSAPKMEKAKIAKRIVSLIRQAIPPGRFLQQSKADGSWNDIGDLKAREKASQALREKAPEARIVFSAAAELLNTKEGRVASSSSSDRKWPPMPETVQDRDTEVDRDEGPQTRSRSPSPYRRYHRANQPSYDDDMPTYISAPSASMVEAEHHSPYASGASASSPYHLQAPCVHEGNLSYGMGNPASVHADPAYEVRHLSSEYQDPMTRVSSDELNEFDVLLGRGAGVNLHPGNLRFRDIVQRHRISYSQAHKLEKASIAQYIVDQVRRCRGRFLVKDTDDDDLWIEVDTDRAREKTSQALREKINDSPKRKFHVHHHATPQPQPQQQHAYPYYQDEHLSWSHAHPQSVLVPSQPQHYSYIPSHEVHVWRPPPNSHPSSDGAPQYGGYYVKRRKVHSYAP